MHVYLPGDAKIERKKPATYSCLFLFVRHVTSIFSFFLIHSFARIDLFLIEKKKNIRMHIRIRTVTHVFSYLDKLIERNRRSKSNLYFVF